MCLNFNLNQAMALAMVREDAGPLVHSLRTLPRLPVDDQWAMFVRNHDEWSLDKLTEAERTEAFKELGPKPDMQLYGRGIRRRLPTMLDGEQARIRMVYSLAFALPGAPILFYGEEIGMAENLEIPGRASVRSPMQWSDAANGGFSTAAAEALRRPVVAGEQWGPAGVNVEDQLRQETSLLKWMMRLVRCRRQCPEVGFGAWQILKSPHKGVVALRYDVEERTVITVHNLARRRCRTRLELGGDEGWLGLTDLLDGARYELAADGTLELPLEGYGLRWFRARKAGATMVL
jgi:maltose alpha-D-glucosyltransferase/alpha-amylase